MRNNETGGIQSVRRALRILDLLAEGEAGGVTEIAGRLRVHKATASRLLATLAEGGLVRRDAETERYRLGYGVLHLAAALNADLDLARQARPFLERLAETTQETVNIAVLEGRETVHLDQIAGTRSVVSRSWVGRRTPFHCTANGKILAAFLPDEERARLLAAPLVRRTPRTVVDRRRLRALLRDARSRDEARAVGELEEGLNAVAAPVRDARGEVVAAVSVSGPSFRMRPSRLPAIARLAREAADAISESLGYMERRTSRGHR